MSFSSQQYRAPAKINLSLEVLRKREDGFHEISSLMLPISLTDGLQVTLIDSTERIRLDCDDETLPTGSENLVYRAAAAYLEKWDLDSEKALHIELEKCIPHGAGLGGGSSDAAAMLMALQEISGQALSERVLHDIASKLGSDVPFFLYKGACQISGRGERVNPLSEQERQVLKGASILLVKPDFGISTPWAYGAWSESLESPGLPYQELEWRGHVVTNDLERPVFAKYPYLGLLKKWLLERKEVEVALMSGSGSTVFAVFKEGLSTSVLDGLEQELLEAFSSGQAEVEAHSGDKLRLWRAETL